jgi:Tripartite tricarboxylate transporter TctB family
VTLRRDHIAGGAFLAVGVLVLAASTDLPFGTLASPGAGMLPMLIVGFMVAFALALLLRAGDSPPLADVTWDDFPHAVRLIAVTTVSVAVYTTLGFAVTIPVMLFALTFLVERKPFLRALIFSIGVSAGTYVLFAQLLKTPLERGIFGF